MAMSMPTSKDSKVCECGNEMQWNELTMLCYHENVQDAMNWNNAY